MLRGLQRADRGLYPRSRAAISRRKLALLSVTGLTLATGVNEGFVIALRTKPLLDLPIYTHKSILQHAEEQELSERPTG